MNSKARSITRFEPVELSGLPAPVEAATDVVFGRGGQESLALDLYRPAGSPAQRPPVVVFIHGGGWHGGDKESYSDLAARMASHEYICASVNYRLSGGARFPAALEDCKCAVRWLRTHASQLNAEPQRFATWGHSAGGHLAAMVGLTPGLFEGDGGWPEHSSQVHCALCFSAPLDLATLGQSLKGSLDLFLGGEAADGNPRQQASPINYVRAHSPPFFICHGAQDDLVPVDQSERFVKALRDAGATVEFMRVPDAGHDVERHSEGIFATALALLDKYLKQRPA